MAKKKYNVELTRLAESMLLRHTDFLAQVSPIAARRLVADAKNVASRLAINPYQFPYADELDVPGVPLETYRKCIFGGRYKAIFIVEGNNVYIDAIVDCRQNNINLL